MGVLTKTKQDYPRPLSRSTVLTVSSHSHTMHTYLATIPDSQASPLPCSHTSHTAESHTPQPILPLTRTRVDATMHAIHYSNNTHAFYSWSTLEHYSVIRFSYLYIYLQYIGFPIYIEYPHIGYPHINYSHKDYPHSYNLLTPPPPLPLIST